MTTTFFEFVYVLWQYRQGCINRDYNSSYRKGFFRATNVFIAHSLEKTHHVSGSPSYERGKNFNYEEGLRKVKNNYKTGRGNWPDEYLDGYEKALEIFEEAEDL